MCYVLLLIIHFLGNMCFWWLSTPGIWKLNLFSLSGDPGCEPVHQVIRVLCVPVWRSLRPPHNWGGLQHTDVRSWRKLLSSRYIRTYVQTSFVGLSFSSSPVPAWLTSSTWFGGEGEVEKKDEKNKADTKYRGCNTEILFFNQQELFKG